MPGLWARSSLGGVQEIHVSLTCWCFSLSFSLPSPLSKKCKINKIFKKRKLFRTMLGRKEVLSIYFPAHRKGGVQWNIAQGHLVHACTYERLTARVYFDHLWSVLISHYVHLDWLVTELYGLFIIFYIILESKSLVLKHYCTLESMECLLKMQFLGSQPREFDSVNMKWTQKYFKQALQVCPLGNSGGSGKVIWKK